MTREEVIKGLECCTSIQRDGGENCYMGDCDNCPIKSEEYREQGIAACQEFNNADVDVPLSLIKAALELLKAQEPRVMTLEEVKQERICWIEDADDGMTVRLFPATMFGIGEYANGSKSYMFLAQKPWAIDANDCEWWYLIEDYGEIWRCWTSRPTDEQREATPWKN